MSKYGWIIDADHIKEPGAMPGNNLNAVGVSGPRGLDNQNRLAARDDHCRYFIANADSG